MMNSNIIICAPDLKLTGGALLDLSLRSWGQGSKSMLPALEAAVTRTVNVTAVHEGKLIGCARLLTDGFFATVPEILVDRSYQRQGIGKALMSKILTLAPDRIGFGAQPGREQFFQDCGFVKTEMIWFQKPIS